MDPRVAHSLHMLAHHFVLCKAHVCIMRLVRAMGTTGRGERSHAGRVVDDGGDAAAAAVALQHAASRFSAGAASLRAYLDDATVPSAPDGAHPAAVTAHMYLAAATAHAAAPIGALLDAADAFCVAAGVAIDRLVAATAPDRATLEAALRPVDDAHRAYAAACAALVAADPANQLLVGRVRVAQYAPDARAPLTSADEMVQMLAALVAAELQ